MKKNKSFYTWLFIVIVLSILLILSIYLGISGWYFSNDNSRVTDFQLGNNIEIECNKNKANAVSLNFNGSIISGEKLKQVVALKNFDQEGDIYVRAKCYVYSSANEKEPISLITTEDWQFNKEDGYYYFKESIPAQNKITLCKMLYLDEEYTLSSNQNYIITFLIESLSVDHTIETFWGYNFIE